MDEAGLETLQSVYESDNNNKDQPMRAVPPENIKAGKIIMELFPNDSPKVIEYINNNSPSHSTVLQQNIEYIYIYTI